MKKASKDKSGDELRKDYDFRGGVRGKYADRYKEGTNVVLLAPDVAEYFPDSDAVNAALRVIVEVARKNAKRKTA